MKKENIILNTIVFKSKLDQNIRQIDLLSEAKKLGIMRVEIRREFLNDQSIEEELINLKQEADKLGIELFYSVDEDFIVQDKVNPMLEQLRREAEIIGAPFLKVNVGNASKVTINYLASYRKLLENGVGIKIENNQHPKFASIDNCQLMLNKCKKAELPITFVFDTGNWAFVGEEYNKALKQFFKETTYVHIKNYKAKINDNQITALTEGDLIIDKLLPYFENLEYVALEYPCTLEELKSDIDFLEKLKFEL